MGSSRDCDFRNWGIHEKTSLGDREHTLWGVEEIRSLRDGELSS